jgi:signal transduction histidine kinase
VSCDVGDDLWVQADPALLAHVVENLVGNAARHTPAGTRVQIGARRDGDDVELVVADDGPGIDEADLPHVLERFFRAGEATTRTPGGLGLGLALSQEILAAHGRSIEVASVAGSGARFSFRLDASPPPAGRA